MVLGKNKDKSVAPKAPKEKKKSFAERYFDEATGWERDFVMRAKKSEKTAWVVAITAALVALIAVFAVAMLTPLKTVEPFLVRVDNNTGMVDIVTVMKEQKTNYEEAINKNFIRQYIIAREGWLYQTHKEDYEKVGIFSTPEEQQVYALQMNPRDNPASPLNLYGENSQVKVKIKNISFINANTALVRFTKTVVQSGNNAPPSHWIATIPFIYYPAPMQEKDRWINPLGFQVEKGYRTDAELIPAGDH